jgi:hypothetical protein
MARLPPEHLRNEAPRVLERRLFNVGFDESLSVGALHPCLALWNKAEFAQQVAADHQAGRLEHVQPIEIGVA